MEASESSYQLIIICSSSHQPLGHTIITIDICIDIPYKPNLEALGKYFTLTPFITKDGIVTDTRYINDTGTPMLDTIVFYDKAYKNGLHGTLWRIEAKISIANFRALALPLYEFKHITDIARISA